MTIQTTSDICSLILGNNYNPYIYIYVYLHILCSCCKISFLETSKEYCTICYSLHCYQGEIKFNVCLGIINIIYRTVSTLVQSLEN